MSRRKLSVEQENYVLRKKLSYYKAALVLARLERDAARRAVINFNLQQALKELEESYK